MNDIQAANLAKRVQMLEIQVSELRNLMLAAKPVESRKTDEKEARVVSNIKKFGAQDGVMFSMRLKGPQTKEEIKKTLDVWGLPYLSWFDGGNFNNRLLKKAIVKIDGRNENGEEIYSLTMNGEKMADEKLAGLGASK